jgi:hypothetical protein
MAFDLSQPSKLPLSFDAHVIVNTVTGDTHEVAAHFASIAMLNFFRDPANSGWGQFFETMELRMEQMNFISKMAESLGEGGPPDFENELVKVGPFVTWDACSHIKSQELMTQSMERFCAQAGDLVRPIDRKVAAQLRGEMITNYGTEAEKEALGDGLVVDPVHFKKKVHTVGEVASRARQSRMEEMFSGLGGPGGPKFRAIEVTPEMMKEKGGLAGIIGSIIKGIEDEEEEKKKG